jgi:hypothetical protein
VDKLRIPEGKQVSLPAQEVPVKNKIITLEPLVKLTKRQA